MHPRIPIRLNTMIIVQWSQYLNARGEGLNVTAYKMKGRTKSRGVKPKAPMMALMSPKKGIAAETRVAKATNPTRRKKRGIRFRAAYFPFATSDDLPSKISNVGCAYT